MSPFRRKLITWFAPLAFAAAAIAQTVHASPETGEAHGGVAVIFLWIAIVLMAAKLSSLIEKAGQPSVLGELLVGVALGNLGLIGIHYFEPLAADPIMRFLAELGVVLLLFQIGLESNIQKMKTVGARAGIVAIVGVLIPFLLGMYVVGPWLLPGLSTNAYMFIGATLTATSVGITARVFRDLKRLSSSEAQIVLGAAVIDDVLGLIILAVVSAIVELGTVSVGAVGIIVIKSVAFLLGAILIGPRIAPRLNHLFSKIHTGIGMKFTLALSFGLAMAFLAQEIGLAPIVGAFAAGLVLDAVHFRSFSDSGVVRELREKMETMPAEESAKLESVAAHHSERHIEDLFEPLGHFLVPIFFVLTGMGVKLETLFDPSILLTALGITVVAFVGKILAGAVAGNVNKWIVGWGMVPRGEVGLIFATIGRTLGVISDQVFSVMVVVVILSTLLTPPILAALIKRQDRKGVVDAPAVS